MWHQAHLSLHQAKKNGKKFDKNFFNKHELNKVNQKGFYEKVKYIIENKEKRKKEKEKGRNI